MAISDMESTQIKSMLSLLRYALSPPDIPIRRRAFSIKVNTKQRKGR
jgi:hypothetical protein